MLADLSGSDIWRQGGGFVNSYAWCAYATIIATDYGGSASGIYGDAGGINTRQSLPFELAVQA